MEPDSKIAPSANEPVLSTLNRDGSRLRIRPKLAQGRFQHRRAIVAYALIALFVLIPYLHLNGKPLILLDLAAREFTFFGHTFLPTDTILLMFLGLTITVLVLLLTALFGRAWCGWACPQTVYMEFLYRPVERLFEGTPAQQRKIDRGGFGNRRRLAKNAVFLLLSTFVAHVFLAYFVGVDTLVQWVQASPKDHPAAFMIMAGVTGLMFFDFAYFREQTCLIACPYGRLQSVLLDRSSLIVGYDSKRGEPRGKAKKSRKKLPVVGESGSARALGACVDCGACVHVCPTGIDIRKGLQMECITCTQCIDACDSIMDKLGRERGLIRYSTQDELAGGVRKLLRPRVIIYPAILLACIGLFVYFLGTSPDADVTILRTTAPFSQFDDGRVSNQILLKITNKTEARRSYVVSVEGVPDAEVVAPPSISLEPRASQTINLIINSQPYRYVDGLRSATIRVVDDKGWEQVIRHQLLGPRGAQ